MNVELMRLWLMNRYKNSASWLAKVKKMPDSQVIAIYKRLNS